MQDTFGERINALREEFEQKLERQQLDLNIQIEELQEEVKELRDEVGAMKVKAKVGSFEELDEFH